MPAKPSALWLWALRERARWIPLPLPCWVPGQPDREPVPGCARRAGRGEAWGQDRHTTDSTLLPQILMSVQQQDCLVALRGAASTQRAPSAASVPEDTGRRAWGVLPAWVSATHQRNIPARAGLSQGLLPSCRPTLSFFLSSLQA